MAEICGRILVSNAHCILVFLVILRRLICVLLLFVFVCNVKNMFGYKVFYSGRQ